MIKLLHGADFHLDSPFDSLPESKAAKRRTEQRNLLADLAALSLKESVDAVLLAGDMLDSTRSYYETSEALLKAFEVIQAPVFIAPGNHDYYSKSSPWSVLKLPDHVHVFTSPEPRPIELPGKNCMIWGAAFTGDYSAPLLPSLPKLDSSKLHIMVLHGEMGGEKYNPITEADIAGSGLNYLALGHEHTYSGLQRSGTTYYAYPGCPEGRGFDETGEKGVLLTEVSRSGVSDQFVPLARRQYHRLQIDLSQTSDVERAIMSAIPKGAERDIYKLLLTGEFSGRLDLERLHRAVDKRFFHVVLRDHTRIKRDIWAQAEEDSLRGLFLRKMRTKYEAAPDDAQREKIILAIRYGLAAMDNGEEWLV